MYGAIFVVFVNVVNIEKFQYFNVKGKGLMCQDKVVRMASSRKVGRISRVTIK